MLQRAFIIFIVALTILITTFFVVPLVPYVNRWYQLVVVQSASMEPVLPVGSLVMYREASNYEPTEIVVYDADPDPTDTLIVHRIIIKELADNGEVTYVTRGDALDKDTIQHVRNDQVKGKVLVALPKVGHLICWLQTPLGVMLALHIPFIWLLIIYIGSL